MSQVNTDLNLTNAPPPPQNQYNQAVVFRYDGLAIYGFPVPEENITLVLGFSIREFCYWDFRAIDVFDLHEVIKEEGDGFAKDS